MSSCADDGRANDSELLGSFPEVYRVESIRTALHPQAEDATSLFLRSSLPTLLDTGVGTGFSESHHRRGRRGLHFPGW